MPASLIAQFAVKDPAKMQEYAAQAGPLVKEFGGTVVVRDAAAGATFIAVEAS